MTDASSHRSGPRFATIALVAAWVLLLAVVGAAVGYVAVRTQQMQTAESSATAPAESAVALPAKTPPAQTVAEAPPEPEAAVAGNDTPAAVPEPEPTAPEGAPAEAKVAQAPDEEAAAEPEPEPETPAPEAPAEAKAETPPPQPATEAPAPRQTQEAAVPRAPAPEPSPEPPPAPEPEPEAEPTPLWQRNSQPFDKTDERPRVALVVSGLGLSRAATEAAIRQLPGAVTLSFTPYSRQLNEWIALARAYGHEVLIDLPMEPVSYPEDDPGPQALLTALSPAQNRSRLDWALKRASGYVGVVPVMGSRFTASEAHIEPILEDLKARGLIFLDNRASDDSVARDVATRIGLPNAVNARFLDRTQASRVAVDERLKQLERIARTEGSAVAIGRPFPVTIELLREWTKKLDEKGLMLAPISAIAAPGRAQRAAVSRPPSE